MNGNVLLKAIVLAAGFVVAVIMGNLLVTDALTAAIWILCAGAVVITVYLERRIWLLIPFLGAVELSVRVPSQPTTILLAQLWFIAFSLVLFLMRKLPCRIRFTELEFWFLLISLFVLQAYIRNPTGLNVFGGGSVGGKPYVLFAINLVAALILSGLSVQPKELKTAVVLSIFGGLINLGVSIVGKFVPSVGFWTGTGDLRAGEVNYEGVGKTYDAGQASRIGFLGSFARNASLWLSSFVSPLRACIHPLWGLLLVVTVVAAALSGFRNAVVTIGLTYFVGLLYRGGFGAMLIAVFGGILGVIFLAVGNMVAPFPPNIQRALSFLPGTWEERYVDDAEGSSEWRFELWKEVLKSDKYIHNKWFGDGLGFSAEDLQKSIALSQSHAIGASGFDMHRESILLSGDYHSGPVQTIRIIGYVGLFFLLAAMVRLAVHAHRQIMRCKNTEWFSVALFTGIPLVWNPFFFVFVFGDFKSAAATLLLGGAMVRLLENNLPLPAYVKAGARIPMPLLSKTAKSLPS